MELFHHLKVHLSCSFESIMQIFFMCTFPAVTGSQSYWTTEGKRVIFNRTFSNNTYFYCKSCKTLYLRDGDNSTDNSTGPCFLRESDNVTVCSHVCFSNAVIYPGTFDDNIYIKSVLWAYNFCREQFLYFTAIAKFALVVWTVAYIMHTKTGPLCQWNY